MNEIKKYQFHIDDSYSEHGYKNVPVFLSEDGVLSIEGYVSGYFHISDLFIYSWEIDGKGYYFKDKYSVFLQKSITDFLNKTNDYHIYIKKIVVREDASRQFYSENGCLVDNYHRELCLITEECQELNLRSLKNVKNIGKHAGNFWEEGGTLVIPETIMSIEKMAFCSSKISNLVFEGNPGGEFPLEINQFAFFMCDNLRTADFGTRKIKVYSEAFACSGIVNLNIPENVEISDGGFQELNRAKNINIKTKNIPPRGFASTGKYEANGCTINMEGVSNITIDRNYNAVFKNSKLGKVIISGEFYKKLIMADSFKSWNDNIEEIDIRWYGDKTGKITGQKR